MPQILDIRSRYNLTMGVALALKVTVTYKEGGCVYHRVDSKTVSILCSASHIHASDEVTATLLAPCKLTIPFWLFPVNQCLSH